MELYEVSDFARRPIHQALRSYQQTGEDGQGYRGHALVANHRRQDFANRQYGIRTTEITQPSLLPSLHGQSAHHPELQAVSGPAGHHLSTISCTDGVVGERQPARQRDCPQVDFRNKHRDAAHPTHGETGARHPHPRTGRQPPTHRIAHQRGTGAGKRGRRGSVGLAQWLQPMRTGYRLGDKTGTRTGRNHRETARKV